MKYGFIGCGNMGGALATALAKTTTDFMLTDRSGRGTALAEELGGSYGTLEQVLAAKRIFLGVKPQMMQGVLKEARPMLKTYRPLLITMAAGLTMDRILEMADCDLPIIRIMPNTAVAVGKGVMLYCANEKVTTEVLEDFLADMSAVGWAMVLEEKLMDAGSALSGSSPAFVYLFLDALADGAVACGIPRTQALELAAMTLIGAGEMYLATGAHPGSLKDAVCSPAGSTIEGIRELESRGFRSAVTEAVCATCEKNKVLGRT